MYASSFMHEGTEQDSFSGFLEAPTTAMTSYFFRISLGDIVVLGLWVWDVVLASDLASCPVAKKMLRADRALALGSYALELCIEQCDGDDIEHGCQIEGNVKSSCCQDQAANHSGYAVRYPPNDSVDRTRQSSLVLGHDAHQIGIAQWSCHVHQSCSHDVEPAGQSDVGDDRDAQHEG